MGESEMSVCNKRPNGKPPISLVPSYPIKETAYALEYGAGKHGRYNYRNGTDWSVYLDAALRHLLDLKEGIEIDPESGRHHGGHAIADIMIFMEMQRLGVGVDDRPK